MIFPSTNRIMRAIFYGGGSALLILDVFLLIRAIFTTNFVPVLPILVGILTAGGLLAILFAEQKAREEDERDHRRISRVAHQLTNPLKNLQDNLNQLLEHADRLPADQRLMVKKMETKSNVLLNNVRDVFLTLQAQEGPISHNLRTYNICTIVHEAVERAQPLASARNVELLYKTHCSSAAVKLDRQLMLLALAHLIENGIYYTRTPGQVNIAITKGKSKVRIVLQDRGIGISPDEDYLVARPFARGPEAEKYDPDGIGLGVALSSMIIKEWGGKITWSHRQSRTGTQFEIHLPLAQKK